MALNSNYFAKEILWLLDNIRVYGLTVFSVIVLSKKGKILIDSMTCFINLFIFYQLHSQIKKMLTPCPCIMLFSGLGKSCIKWISH